MQTGDEAVTETSEPAEPRFRDSRAPAKRRPAAAKRRAVADKLPAAVDERGRVRLNRDLLAWHRVTGRVIPSRESRDPWRLLVFEVMSHQTQLPRAIAALGPFLVRFPTPVALAGASPAEVLRAWAGLGYNRRALALRAAAIAIVERHAGRVPEDLAALVALPGVGPYTARAIAAQAYRVPVGPVDVNVRRVLVRWAGRDLPPVALQVRADALVDHAEPGTWVHAVMDLAVLVCVPRDPRCGQCPVRAACASADQVELHVRRRTPGQPFAETRRWLRGALVRELRSAAPGAWVEMSGGRGAHSPARVREALEALASDGLVELGEGDAARLPVE